MKTAEVKKLQFDTDYPDLTQISEALDKQDEKHHINIVN